MKDDPRCHVVAITRAVTTKRARRVARRATLPELCVVGLLIELRVARMQHMNAHRMDPIDCLQEPYPVRRDEQGILCKRGHIGGGYRASNDADLGRSTPRTKWTAPTSALRSQIGEGGVAHLTRLQADGWLRPQQHPAHHVFTFAQPHTPRQRSPSPGIEESEQQAAP